MEGTREMAASRKDAIPAVGLVWYRIAVAYFAIAVAVGVAMGATGNMSLYSVHSHLNLLGWQSLAVMGLIYQHVPGIARNRMARMQFWLYNTGLPVMMLALAGKDLGYARMEPLLAMSSTVVGVAALLFATNILFSARAAASQATSES